MDDQRIIELFFARSELAIQSLATKYEKLLHKISFYVNEIFKLLLLYVHFLFIFMFLVDCTFPAPMR